MNIHERRLSVWGLVEVHTPSPQLSNALITPTQRETLTTRNNTPGYLRENLFQRTSPDQIYWEEVWDDGKFAGVVNTIFPTQGWGEGAVMVNAAPASLFLPPGSSKETIEDKKARVLVRPIYNNLPLSIEYGRQLIAGIITMEDNPLPSELIHPGLPKVVAMENAMSIVSDRDRLASRSIAIPHVQILQTGLGINSDITPRFSKEHSLERRLKSRYERSSDVIEEIERKTNAALSDRNIQVDFLERTTIPPLGYTMVTPITRDGNLTQNARLLSAIMGIHYDVHIKIAEREIALTSQNSLSFKSHFAKAGIPPYSNRHSYYFMPDRDGIQKLHITVSPVLFGGGVREDNGNSMDRGPQFNPLFPDTVLNSYKRTFKVQLKKRLQHT